MRLNRLYKHMIGKLQIQNKGGEAGKGFIFMAYVVFPGNGRLGELVTILKMNAVRWVDTMKPNSCHPWRHRAWEFREVK